MEGDLKNLTLKARAIDIATLALDIARSSEKNQTIGDFLLATGKITPADAERVLRVQKEQGLRFGDAAKTLGLINEQDIQQVLANHFDFPLLFRGDGEFSPELITAYQPFNTEVETLRTVCSQLILNWFNEGRKTLTVVSPRRGEGRSNLSANLAILFSQLGRKTLLIDANLRQPRQHQLFKLNQTQGLSDLLAGRRDEWVIAPILQFRDLSVLPAGTKPPNPLDLISRDMSACLSHLAEQYDVILIDTPAHELGADSQVLSAKAGGALFLAHQHNTRLAELEKMKGLFESTGTVCVGAIVTDF
jgi:protein-tyrosine kinase